MFSYRFPVVRGVQANKEYFIGMLPLEYLSKLFPDDPDVVAPEFRAQRRVNEQRIPAIRDYILKNRTSYVFSALSASIDGNFKFIPSEVSLDLGILEVEMNSVFLINDGQHRKASLDEALKEDPSLKKETISIVFFKDDGLKRSQQMFTDLNKHAVKTSNSLSTLYDTRDPLAVITKNIVNKISFFHDFTDKERDNLGKNSGKLFTLTTLYKANKRILAGYDVSSKTEAFLVSFWKNISENIAEWQELMKKQITKRDLREDYIITLGVVLLAFGRLGASLYPQKDLSVDFSKLKQINWLRNNKEWEGRCIRENGHIINNEEAILLTGNVLKKMLNISLTKEELLKEQKLKEQKCRRK